MQKILVIIIVLLAFLGIAPLSPPAPVGAQPPSMPCDIDVTWVNVTGTPDYVSFTQKLNGTDPDFIPLTRTDNQNLRQPSVITNANWQIAQNYITDWLCTPTLVRFVWKRETTNSGYARVETSMDGVTWTNQTTGLTNASIALNSPTSTTRTATWTNPDNVSYTHIRLSAGSAQPRILTMEIVAPDGMYIGEYVTPLNPTDEVSLSDDDDNTIATATRPFLPVYAPYNGTVTSITPLDSDDCTGLGVASVTCATISQSGSHLVTLSLDDGFTYQYIMVASYINEGDTITSGCVMGETTQVIGLVVSTIPLEFYTLDTPDDDIPCSSIQIDRCLTNSLADESTWYKAGSIQWGDEVVLQPGARIYQIISLPKNILSRLQVNGKNGNAELRLGVTINVVILASEYSIAEIGWGKHEPNLVDFTEVSVKNVGTSPMTISSVCVELDGNGDGEADDGIGENDFTVPDNPCYFRNYGFSDGLDQWSITGGAEDGTGQILVPDLGGFAQTIRLYPNTYNLSLDVGLWMDDDFDLDTNGSEIITVSYVFPLDEPPEYMDFEPFAIGDIGDNWNYRISVNFTITEQTDGDIYFEIDTPSLSGLDGLIVSRACLRPANGDWGDYPPPDDGTPFTEACEVISPPRGNDFRQWIDWHWHNFNQFFECDLMVTLNNSYGLMRWFQAMFMLLMNWLGDLGQWLNGHFQNVITAILAGDAIVAYEMPSDVEAGGFGISFPSGLSGIQSEPDSPQSGETCNWYDVFCHGRNLVGGVINFAGGILSDVVSVLVNFIGALLAQIVDLITLGYRTYIEPIVNLWDDFWELIGKVKDTIVYIFEGENMLMTMWNDTEPVPPPGLQDCSELPETKTLCLIYLVVDNTLLSGDWGALIIPLLSSILGIFGLYMIINDFMQLVRTARDA